MPELKCTVQTCMHNQDFLCRLDSIQVGGSQAKASKETCCDSFEERKTQGDRQPSKKRCQAIKPSTASSLSLLICTEMWRTLCRPYDTHRNLPR